MVSEPERDELLAAFARNVRERIARDLERERVEQDALQRRVVDAVVEAMESARRDGLCGRAWLFGSFAWGQPNERSDVDLLVEGVRDPDQLAAILSAKCRRDVHVIARERAPDSLAARAVATGRAL